MKSKYAIQLWDMSEASIPFDFSFLRVEPYEFEDDEPGEYEHDLTHKIEEAMCFDDEAACLTEIATLLSKEEFKLYAMRPFKFYHSDNLPAAYKQFGL